ncbi:MAG: hypothetical protein ACM30G_15945 [Micromonosporaceae bacterium]
MSSQDRTADGPPAGLAAPPPGLAAPLLPAWLPAAVVAAAAAIVWLATGTASADIIRYAGYVGYAVVAPGTLVYRALRRTPFTLVEDLAYGAAVGLVLEIAAWALWSALGLGGWLWTWPLVVLGAFAAVPRLRRHWWVRGYTRVPAGFAWSVAAVCVFFLGYLYVVFLNVNPILPATNDRLVYVDLPYQLSLAGEAKHHFPMHLPQVAQEPLQYHWFDFAHMGAASLISGVDLPVVFYRLDVPLICLASIVALAVTGWRASGRPAVGAIAAALTYVVGELNFNKPEGWPFGTIATFIVWSSMSMNYSWLLLIALIGVLVSVVASADHPVASMGRGALGLTALLALGSAGAKTSSLPVVLGALAIAAVVALLRRRRIERMLLAAIVIVLGAEAFAYVFIYAFATHGTMIKPFWGMRRFYPAGGGPLVMAAIAAAFAGNMLLRLAGVPVLLALRGFRQRLGDVEWLLLGGLAAGFGAYLVVGHLGDGNQYFYRDGWMFGIIASAWGVVLLADRARLTPAFRAGLAAAGAVFAVALVAAQLRYAGPTVWHQPMDPLVPVLRWLGVLALLALLGAMWWRVLRSLQPALRGRGGLVLLTGVLLAGMPGLVMDAASAHAQPNGGGYVGVWLPAYRVEAARWLRDHSSPDDVIATNAHCLYITEEGYCDSRSFWLSTYAERRVLIEGWLFAPRTAELVEQTGAGVYTPFWDQALLRLNDAAFTAPSSDLLARLRDEYGVRWLVLDRAWHEEPAELLDLTDKRYDDGVIAIYRLR